MAPGFRRRRGRGRRIDRSLLLESLPAWVRDQIEQATTKKPAKYRNRKVTVDGITFDSKREAARHAELVLLERAGEIRELKRQPVFELHGAKGTKVGRFTPDFEYVDAATGARVVEDVKSKASRTTAYMLRKRIFEAEYGIHLTEIY